MLASLQQAAAAVFFCRIAAAAAIAGIKPAVADGEHFIDVFFHNPRLAHPPTGHLIHNGIGPQVFFDFGFNVVARIDNGFLNHVAEAA